MNVKELLKKCQADKTAVLATNFHLRQLLIVPVIHTGNHIKLDRRLI